MIWHNLYERHTKGRSNARKLLTALRPVLTDLRSRTGLHQGFPAQWASQLNRESGLEEWFMAVPGGVVKLPTTSEVDGVRLTLLAMVEPRADHLQRFTAMLEGRRTQDDTAWTVAIHLENDAATGGDRKGLGACGHAAWHCHVGPGLGAVPKVRVPLPGLKPADALQWVLTTLVAAMEPAPWTRAPAPVRPRA